MDQIQTQESLGSSNSNDENVGLTVQSSNEVQTDFKELCDDPTIDFCKFDLQLLTLICKAIKISISFFFQQFKYRPLSHQSMKLFTKKQLNNRLTSFLQHQLGC